MSSANTDPLYVITCLKCGYESWSTGKVDHCLSNKGCNGEVLVESTVERDRRLFEEKKLPWYVMNKYQRRLNDETTKCTNP